MAASSGKAACTDHGWTTCATAFTAAGEAFGATAGSDLAGALLGLLLVAGHGLHLG